ncbi:22942_t:CDS:2 [Rhizophagus irregularis]|nr:22942_t:CDS:2 [Rhizophagus irregularis]
MSDLSTADIKYLKAKNIIYMDQIVSSDGIIYSRGLITNLRLIYPLNDVVYDLNRTHKSPPTIPDNNVQKQIIFGKTLTQETDRSTSISYLQHFIPQQTHHNNSLTPKKQLLGLVACKGCLLHSYYPHDARPTCVIAIRTQKLLLFNIFKKSSFEHKSLLEFYSHQNFVVATKPFHTLRHIAYEHFIKIDKSPLNNSLQRPLDAILTPYPSLPSNNIDNHIYQALICHPDLKVDLKSCAK